MSLQLRAALLGDMDQEIARGRSRIARAARTAVDGVASSTQSKLRQDVASSGLARGDVLQKTWRMRSYPPGGRETMSPAALVYSTMPQVVMAFEKGATVTVNGKKGVLVPNSEVWGEERIRRPSGRGARATSTFEVARIRFGRLQWIPITNGRRLVGVFVANLGQGRTKSGRRRKAGVRALRSGKYDRAVVFWVVSEAKLPRLLRGDVIRARVQRDAPNEIARRFIAAFERGDGARLAITGPTGE